MPIPRGTLGVDICMPSQAIHSRTQRNTDFQHMLISVQLFLEFFNLKKKTKLIHHKLGYLKKTKKKKKRNMILIDEWKIPLDTHTHTHFAIISKPIESVFASIYLHLFFIFRHLITSYNIIRIHARVLCLCAEWWKNGCKKESSTSWREQGREKWVLNGRVSLSRAIIMSPSLCADDCVHLKE